MKAAVIEQVGKPMVIQDIPMPVIGPRDALVKVAACGVCHTDLHLAEGFFRPLGIDVFPIVPGHEVVGVVEEVGADVKHLKRGDRVGAAFFQTCGLCPHCLGGRETACHSLFSGPRMTGFSLNGGYAEFMSTPAEFLVSVPDELAFTDAAPLFCGGITMYGALKQAGVRADQRVAILGMGGLGHMGVAIAKAMGAEVVALTSAGKESWAMELGADRVIARNGNVGQQLLALGGADVIVSTTIDPTDINNVLQGLRPRGSFVLTGMTTEPFSLMPAGFAFAQQRVIGSVIGTRREHAELLDLAVRHRIRPVTETYPLADANAVHDRLREQKVRLRAVLLPS
jgi:D-arabinose 1-dehydrogenase-like Zn-dependent alcohol dehydrogenase